MTTEIAIVGAGPAAIGTVLALLEEDVPGENITILESGPSSNERSEFSLRGFGGVGLCSDVKLCISPLVGNELWEIASKDAFERYERDTIFRKDILKQLDIMQPGNKHLLEMLIVEQNFKKLAEYHKHVTDLFFHDHEKRLENSCPSGDLEYFSDYNPVIHLGTDGGKKRAREMEKCFAENGINISFNTNINEINQEKFGFELVSDNDSYPADYLLFAAGKSGGKWATNQATKLGAKTEKTLPAIGIRFEDRKENLPLSRLGDDAKIKLPFGASLMHNTMQIFNRKPPDIYYVKTHCVCEGGKVLSYPYDSPEGSIVILGGASESERKGII